jgi:AcrR family transcriptional regulator
MSSTRDRILAAAIELFSAHGYHGASIEKIAAKAGFSSVYVQRIFKTKHALFNEALITAIERSGLGRASTQSSEGTFTEQIKNWAFGYAQSVACSPHVMRLVFYAGLDHPEAVRKILVEYMAPLYDFLLALILHAKHTGEIRAEIDPYVAIRGLIGPIVYHYTHTHIYAANRLHKFRIKRSDIEEYIEIWLRGVCNR